MTLFRPQYDNSEVLLFKRDQPGNGHSSGLPTYRIDITPEVYTCYQRLRTSNLKINLIKGLSQTSPNKRTFRAKIAAISAQTNLLLQRFQGTPKNAIKSYKLLVFCHSLNGSDDSLKALSTLTSPHKKYVWHQNSKIDSGTSCLYSDHHYLSSESVWPLGSRPNGSNLETTQ